MAKSHLPREFNVNSLLEWVVWKQQFEQFTDISKLSVKKGQYMYQVSPLLYVMQPKSENIMTSFNLSMDNSKNLETVLEKFDTISNLIKM